MAFPHRNTVRAAVLQVVHRVITRHLLGQADLKADDADSGAVTLIQRFGSAANLNGREETVRSHEQEQAWRWVDPILDAWAADTVGPRPYAAGGWGPAAASALVQPAAGDLRARA